MNKDEFLREIEEARRNFFIKCSGESWTSHYRQATYSVGNALRAGYDSQVFGVSLDKDPCALLEKWPERDERYESENENPVEFLMSVVENFRSMLFREILSHALTSSFGDVKDEGRAVVLWYLYYDYEYLIEYIEKIYDEAGLINVDACACSLGLLGVLSFYGTRYIRTSDPINPPCGIKSYGNIPVDPPGPWTAEEIIKELHMYHGLDYQMLRNRIFQSIERGWPSEDDKHFSDRVKKVMDSYDVAGAIAAAELFACLDFCR